MFLELFKTEFKRALAPDLQLAVVVTGAAFLTGGLWPRLLGLDQVEDVIADGLGILILLFAFVSGVRAFSKIKRDHISFLFALPVSKPKTWIIVAAAHLFAACTATAIVLLAQPKVLGSQVSIIYSIAIYLNLYVLGCCLVLVFTQTTAVAVIAFVVMLVISSATRAAVGVLDAAGPDVLIETIGLIVLTFLFCAASIVIFRRSEFDHIRVKLRNLGLLGLSVLTFVVFLFFLIVSGIPRSFGGWHEGFLRAALSRDGTRLALLRRHTKYLYFNRLDFIDANTGIKTGQYSGTEIDLSPGWSSNGSVLNATSHSVNSAALLRLAPDGAIRDKVDASSYVRVRRSERDALFVQSFDFTGRPGFFLTSDTSGPLDLLPDVEDVYFLGNRRLLRFASGELQFLFSDQKISNRIENKEFYRLWVVNSVAFSRPDEVRIELERIFSAPPGKDGVGAFLLPRGSIVDTDTPVFYIKVAPSEKVAAIFVHQGSAGWNPLFDGLEVSDTQLAQISRSHGIIDRNIMYGREQRRPWLRIYIDGPFLAFLDSRDTAYLYEGHSDRIVSLGTVAGSGAIYLEPLAGFDALMVTFGNLNHFGRPIDLRSAFVYSKASGTSKPITLGCLPTFVQWLDENGNHICIEAWPQQVTRVTPDGQKRLIWPSGVEK